MNSRAFTLSLVVAGLAMFMVYAFLENKEAEYKEKFGQESSVVIAKVDINEMEIIDDRKIEVISVPQKYLAPGHFKVPENIHNTIASVPIKKGEQITRPRVTYPGERSGLSRQVSIGKRAMAIKVSGDQAVSKLIKPGDRVDVLAMIDYAAGRLDRKKIITVLQDVFVLSTGYNITNAIPLVGVKVDDTIKGLNLNHYSDYDTVTFELTPFEVQKLTFVQTSGASVFLSLRNNDDRKIENVSATNLYDVLGEERGDAKEYFMRIDSEDNRRRGR